MMNDYGAKSIFRHVVFIAGFLSMMSACYSQNKNRELVWSDEFNYDGLPDTAKWGYDTGNGCPDLCGWGNNEKQFYTKNRDQNATVENGKLIIRAIKESFEGFNYTSERLSSKNKGDWKYGRIEVKAKLPSGVSVWPAV